jgi:thiosulfate dehydrogenase [quinone] large subunit
MEQTRRKEARMATTIARPPHEHDTTAAADRAALHPSQIPGPPLATWLFKDTRAAWLWLPLRLYLGWSWLQHGLEKVTNPAWTDSGQALAGFWGNAVTTDPKPVITVGWYREFIEALLGAQAYTWFSDLIVYGEMLVGLALILGAFTGIAAFFGAFMNWNYIMAGSASTNGLLLVIAVGLVVGWKVSGWIGLDRWLLPLLGTPWRPGTLFARPGSTPPLRRTSNTPII